MVRVYDENGEFLGELVKNLTDGPTDELWPADNKPLMTMGQFSPSKAVDEFQRNIWNSMPVYGGRLVYHTDFGSVRQALVPGFGSKLMWINVSRRMS